MSSVLPTTFGRISPIRLTTPDWSPGRDRTSNQAESVCLEAVPLVDSNIRETALVRHQGEETRSLIRDELASPELTELNAALQAAGFSPPGTDVAAWQRLARIVGIDPDGQSVPAIAEAALIWAERTRVQERIRRQVAGLGTTNPPESAAASAPSKLERENTGFAFTGSREWENWGLGLQVDGRWRLFHFHRGFGRWQRHNHATLRVPGGLPEALAQAFVSGRGELTVTAAQCVWQEYSRGYSVGRTIQRVKSPLSRLRRAIQEAIHKEGHRPDGNPFVWQAAANSWQSRLRFGYAVSGEKRGLSFQPVE